MTTFQTLASSSSGNAALLSAGGTHLLIDMGISCRRVCQALAARGLRAEELAAVLITHEHSDHISGLATYIKKYRTPIICTPGTALQLAYRLAGIEDLLRPTALGQTVSFQDAEVTLLPTSHDCRESAAFHIAGPDGAVGYLTDTGYIIDETGRRLLGADLLVLESNHDEDMLLAGPYPYALKKRVLGPQGHLSNRAAALYAVDAARFGARTILLSHLSQDNNTPALALETVGRPLAQAGWTGRLAVSPRDGAGEIYTLEGAAACRG